MTDNTFENIVMNLAIDEIQIPWRQVAVNGIAEFVIICAAVMIAPMLIVHNTWLITPIGVLMGIIGLVCVRSLVTRLNALATLIQVKRRGV